MNTDYLIQTAIMLRTALEAVEAQLAQGRVKALVAQQLVLEEDEPAATGRNLSDKDTHPNRGRPWRAADDEQLLGKLALGKTPQQIADDMGRPDKGITDRMRRLRDRGVL